VTLLRKAIPSRDAAVRAVEVIEARMHPNFRNALMAGVVAFAALLAGNSVDGLHAHSTRRYVAIGLAIVFAVFGVIATRSAAKEAARVAGLRGGPGTATAVRLGVGAIGFLFVLLATLDLLNVRIEQLLLGGAITGVVVGIAAQQSLGNLAAGVILLASRPFGVGQQVRIRSGSLGGTIEGCVTSIGLVYTWLDTDEGAVALPNLGLLSAAVGTIRDPAAASIVYPGEMGRAGRPIGRHTLVR
jgi:small-conductance mechanosensitive channel